MSAKQGVRAATVWGRVATGASVLTASLMLCGFTKPQLPETIYDGARYSALLATYKHAYAAVGMTSAKIAIEAQNRGADGATLTILALSLSCPKSRKASEAPLQRGVQYQRRHQRRHLSRLPGHAHVVRRRSNG